MLGETSAEVLKSIARSRRETNVKIRSLSCLLAALDTVAVVLNRALDRFQASGQQNPSPLTKDMIEPKSLGIHFIYFKDLPLSVSSHLLRKKQAQFEDELSALQKKQQRLETCQGTRLLKKDHSYQPRKEPFNLPMIEEGRLCTPKISVVKVRRDKNGLFKLTEEYTFMGEEEVKSAKTTRSPSWRSWDGSNSKIHDDDYLYSDLIDFDVLEKLDGMDPKARGDYTAQFYRELFEENEWDLLRKNKQNTSNALLSVGKKDRSSEQPVVPSREAVRVRTKVRGRPRSDLAKLFTRKKKDRIMRERNLQTQQTVQCQECPMDKLISKSKRVSERTQITVLQEDVEFSPKVEFLERRKLKAAGGNKQLKKKFSNFQYTEHAVEAGIVTR